MPDEHYAFVVKNALGHYLADPYHHMNWTAVLGRARLFLTEAAADRAAESRGGMVRLILMQETE